MKNLFKIMMAAVIIMGITATAMSKDFKGVISYKISYPGLDIDPGMMAMMPKMATLTIKGDMSKFEINMGQMGSQVQIIDGNAKTVTTLMDMMGQKFYYVESEEEISAQVDDTDDIRIDIKDETKEIAGYKCKKALVTVNDSGDEMIFTIFFTEEIGSSALNIDNPYFKEIPGAMLEFEIDAGQGRMKMEATSVSKKTVSDSEFSIPEGFQKKTSAEIKQMFGGGM
jgi:GLPGLI family protein